MVKLSVKRAKDTRSHAPYASPSRPARDLKQLSNAELAQLTFDIDAELNARSRQPGSGEGMGGAKLAGESHNDAGEQRTAPVQKKLWAAIEKDLKAFYEDGGALRDFEQLVSDGCDREFLIYTVAAIRLAYQFRAEPGSFESLTGFTRKKLTTAIGRMGDCAEDIARLRVDFLARLVPRAHQQLARYMDLRSRLPAELKELAAVTEEAARRLRLRGRPDYNTVIAGLVRHAEERTRTHQRELATVVAFATDNPSFTAEDLHTWRMEHRDLLPAFR